MLRFQTNKPDDLRLVPKTNFRPNCADQDNTMSQFNSRRNRPDLRKCDKFGTVNRPSDACIYRLLRRVKYMDTTLFIILP